MLDNRYLLLLCSSYLWCVIVMIASIVTNVSTSVVLTITFSAAATTVSVSFPLIWISSWSCWISSSFIICNIFSSLKLFNPPKNQCYNHCSVSINLFLKFWKCLWYFSPICRKKVIMCSNKFSPMFLTNKESTWCCHKTNWILTLWHNKIAESCSHLIKYTPIHHCCQLLCIISLVI